MNQTKRTALDNLACALTIHAFDRFRDATHRAGLPVEVANAFAAYRTAVDFAIQASGAELGGNTEDATILTAWATSALSEMDAELAMLADGPVRALDNCPAR